LQYRIGILNIFRRKLWQNRMWEVIHSNYEMDVEYI